MNNSQSKVAIIGLSCRVPGANTAERFWENLTENKVSVVFESENNDKDKDRVIDERLTQHSDYVSAVYGLDNVGDFDASFFYLSAKEAEKMDPQLRIFLETSWQALEHSGYNSENYEGDIGVYASGLTSSYMLANLLPSKSHYHGDVHLLLQDMVARMGNDPNYLATRTSYHLNLTGPSVSVQTACSSSLVAVHQAAEALLSGECDMALAGGVSIRFPNKAGYIYQTDGILSSDGYCRPFEKNANGTVFGDGSGVVILKRFEDAVEDGDTIHAVIAGSAVSNDGADKVGYAAPSVSGQVKAIEQALQVAEINKNDVSYIEAHGTGTQMGDPIEVQALKMVYKNVPQKQIALGSVKGNIGHLSVASGIAGLIKCVMMLKHESIVGTANFENENPECQFEDSPFRVPSSVETWKADAKQRVAGVSSFGMGGTNAHVILTQAPTSEENDAGRNFHVIPISAKSPQALEVAIENALLEMQNEKSELSDIAYTYAMGRRTFNYRHLVLAKDRKQAISALSKMLPANLLSGTGQPSKKPVVFMFPGQGAQYINMGIECYLQERVFRMAVDECCDLLKEHIGLDLREVMWPKEFPSDGPVTRLNETQYTQPSMFVIEYALAKQFLSWGIAPDALIGHSVGEYVCAYISGVMSLSDALKLISHRGKLIQELPKGAMAAVSLNEEKLKALLPETVDIAAINEPTVCTVSGPIEDISNFIEELTKQGIAARKITTSHAFHSSMMEPARKGMQKILKEIKLQAPKIPVISNVTGDWLTNEQAVSADYWADHLCKPVNFSSGVESLLNHDPEQVFIEMGPGQSLASFVRRHPDKEVSHQVITSLGRIKKPTEEYKNLLTAFGRLWLNGVEINWTPFYQDQQRKRVPLPVYPFEREQYVALPDPEYLSANNSQSDRKQPLENWCYTPIWKQANLLIKNEKDLSKKYLLLVDESPFADAMQNILTSMGAEVIVVIAGEEYKHVSDSKYVVRPEQTSDFEALFMALSEQQSLPDAVLHLWGEGLEDAKNDREKFEAAQYLGSYTLIALVQALGNLNIIQPIKHIVLTREAYPVTGDETLRPEQSTVAVLSRVMSQEYAQVDSRLVDIDDAMDSLSLAKMIITESLNNADREYAVAYRNKQRWVQHMDRIEQPDNWQFEDQTRLENKGRYLITGGLGEIGKTISKLLAEKYQSRLSLLVREHMPDPSDWDEYVLDHDTDDLIRQRIEAVRELEAIGSDVIVVCADVSNKEAVTKAVTTTVEAFGGIDGVIHAAGLPGEIWDRTIENAGLPEVRWHYQAKAYGVQVLAEVLEPVAPKFVLLISSIASMLGGLRLGPYGSANHYMDNMGALLNRQQDKTHWVTIDWDVWQHHQDEKRESSTLGKMMDERTVLPEQGLETIERVLAMDGLHQVSVSTWDMGVRAERWIKLSSVQTSKDGNSHISGETGNESDLSLNILGILNAILGSDELGMADDFFEAGGDSLVSVQLLANIRETYSVDVSLAAFLSNPTAENLAQQVKNKLQPEDDILSLIENEFTLQQLDMVELWISEIRTMVEAGESEMAT